MELAKDSISCLCASNAHPPTYKIHIDIAGIIRSFVTPATFGKSSSSVYGKALMGAAEFI